MTKNRIDAAFEFVEERGLPFVHLAERVACVYAAMFSAVLATTMTYQLLREPTVLYVPIALFCYIALWLSIAKLLELSEESSGDVPPSL